MLLYPLTIQKRKKKSESTSGAGDAVEGDIGEDNADEVNPRDSNGLLLNQERFQSNYPTRPLCSLSYPK